LLISPNVHLVDIFYHWNLIEVDPNDNKFIDCAISSNAYCLVSNDKHFNVVKGIDFPKLNVLRLEEFESEFK
jgi:predicted nucleic acid-binding protein